MCLGIACWATACGPPPAVDPGQADPASIGDIAAASWLLLVSPPPNDTLDAAAALAIGPRLVVTTARVAQRMQDLRTTVPGTFFRLYHSSGETAEIERIWIHPEFDEDRPSPDVGLIRVNIDLPAYFDLADDDITRNLQVGQPLQVCGFENSELSLVSFLRGLRDNIEPDLQCVAASLLVQQPFDPNAVPTPRNSTLLEHSANVDETDQGGAVVDEMGRVVALTFASGAKNIGQAVRSDVVQQLPALVAAQGLEGFDFIDPGGELSDEDVCALIGRCCPADDLCNVAECNESDADCAGCPADGRCVLGCGPIDPDCTSADLCAHDGLCCALDNRCDLEGCPRPDSDCVACIADLNCIRGCDPPDPDCGEFVACTRNIDCIDSLFCNGLERCNLTTGQCEDGVLPCDNTGRVCNEIADLCVDPTGCLNDISCDDRRFCNGLERCNLFTGICLAGTRPCADTGTSPSETCIEGNQSCEALPACATDADCDDGLFCNGSEVCEADGCASGSEPCTEPNQTCDEAAAVCAELPPDCVVDIDCDDGLFCNGAETCTAGTCVAATDPCDPALQSCDEMLDACVPLPECVTDEECIDGLFCNGVESCSAGQCDPGIEPCDEETEICDESENACAPAPECAVDNDCDDGLFCNGSEACDAGSCVTATPPCDAATEICDESANACGPIPECAVDEDCDDTLFCNGSEACTSGSCVAGTAPCDAETQTCDEGTDTCTALPDCTVDDDCDDGVFCNGPEQCEAGSCAAGVAPDCDDAVDCTVDGCDEDAAACEHVPNDALCDDDLFCNGLETCSASGCVQGAAPCDTANELCDEDGEICLPAPSCTLDDDCADGQFCNGAETCSDGECAAGAPPCDSATEVCDEAQDTCAPLPDCASAVDCDDGIFCNGPETCDTGACVAGALPDCDDVVACTVDTCDAVLDTCTHVTDDALCNDGLFCNGVESCATDGCVLGVPPCDDAGDPPTELCDETADACLLLEPCGTFQNATLLAIPDDTPSGVTQALEVSDHILINDLKVLLFVDHPRVGDLIVTLSRDATTAQLTHRPGGQGNQLGSLRDGLNVRFATGGAGGPIEDIPLDEGPAIVSPPDYAPDNALTVFNGLDAAGTWTLKLSDRALGDVGNLISWGLVINEAECP